MKRVLQRHINACPDATTVQEFLGALKWAPCAC